jgi:hypothetical protein
MAGIRQNFSTYACARALALHSGAARPAPRDRLEAGLARRERNQRVPIALRLDVLVRVQHRSEGRELELEARIDRRDVVHRCGRAELLLHPGGHVVHLALQEGADRVHHMRKVISAALKTGRLENDSSWLRGRFRQGYVSVISLRNY